MKKKFLIIFVIMLLIPLFYNFKVDANDDNNNTDGEKIKELVTFEGTENVDVKVYDTSTNEELGTEFEFVSGMTVRIVAEAKEGYRIFAWSYEFVNKSNGQTFHNYLATTNLNKFSFKPSKPGIFKVHAVEEDKYGVVVLNKLPDENKQYVISIQKVSEGEIVDFPSTNGKGIGLFRKLIKITNSDYVDYDNTGVYDDLVVYAEYDRQATTVWTIFKDYYPMFFKGLGKTLLFSVIAVFLSLFLGTAVCLLKMSDVKIINFIASAYIEVIRGVPLLLQLLIVYTVLPNMNYGTFFTTEVIACLLALFINSSAYVAEIFRSGIQAVDKGQTEAARALGLSKWQTLIKVVIPQGIKNCLPSIGNELIMVIKETSLASSVNAAIGELMSVQSQIKADSYIVLEPFIIIAIMYFIVTFSLSKVVRLIERRLETHD